MLLLDTHVLVWLDAGERRLGKKARGAADRALAAGELAVSAVSFWETATLLRRQRLSLLRPIAAWRLELLGAGLVELPLNGEIGILSASLEDLPGDPADRMIAASAVVYGCTLLTADRSILGWKSNLTRLDARV